MQYGAVDTTNLLLADIRARARRTKILAASKSSVWTREQLERHVRRAQRSQQSGATR